MNKLLEMRNECLKKPLFLGIESYPPIQKVTYSIDVKDLDEIIDNLPLNLETISYINDIYKYSIHSGFFDRYLYLYYPKGFHPCDQCGGSIIKLYSGFSSELIDIFLETNVNERLNFVNDIIKRYERIKLLYNIINNDNKKISNDRYNDFKIVIEKISENLIEFKEMVELERI